MNMKYLKSNILPCCLRLHPLLCTQLVILWIAAKQIIIQSNKFWITWTV